VGDLQWYVIHTEFYERRKSEFVLLLLATDTATDRRLHTYVQFANESSNDRSTVDRLPTIKSVPEDAGVIEFGIESAYCRFRDSVT
jgi:hypothetical protein